MVVAPFRRSGLEFQTVVLPANNSKITSINYKNSWISSQSTIPINPCWKYHFHVCEHRWSLNLNIFTVENTSVVYCVSNFNIWPDKNSALRKRIICSHGLRAADYGSKPACTLTLLSAFNIYIWLLSEFLLLSPTDSCAQHLESKMLIDVDFTPSFLLVPAAISLIKCKA